MGREYVLNTNEGRREAYADIQAGVSDRRRWECLIYMDQEFDPDSNRILITKAVVPRPREWYEGFRDALRALGIYEVVHAIARYDYIPMATMEETPGEAIERHELNISLPLNAEAEQFMREVHELAAARAEGRAVNKGIWACKE